MAEYIEREAAINETRKPRLTDAELRRRLAHIPAADVVTRDCYDRLLAENDELRKERPGVRGIWTRIDYQPCGHDYQCSECHDFNDRASRYCPNCGTSMEVEHG